MGNHGNIVLLLLMFIIAVRSQTTSYCNFPRCNHTMCIYPNRGASPQCPNPITVGLSEIEKQQILSAHNFYRIRVASGLEIRGNPGPQPAAKNLKSMSWNDEIASIAQRWAEQCRIRSDSCRRTSQYPWVNQNLALRETTDSIDTIHVEDLVQIWTDTVVFFNKNTVTNYTFNSQSDTYSQVVWANTTQLGCGGIKWFEGIYNRFYLVCNYAPGGNLIGQTVYQPAP